MNRTIYDRAWARSAHRPTSLTGRAGVSLLEVIACTALVAVMAIPVSGVIRASGQAIAQSEQDVSTEAKLRRGLRWLSDSIHDGNIVAVRRNRIDVILANGSAVQFSVQSGNLVMDDGSDPVNVVEDVRRIRFTEVRQTTPPNARIGVGMQLIARDPVSGNNVQIDAMASIRPQS